MRLRRRKSHKQVSLSFESANNEDFLRDREVSNAANQERECIARDLVDKLCARLPPILREMFVLYSMEGWSQEELSRAFGVPRRTVKSRIFRARVKLRERWAKYNRLQRNFPSGPRFGVEGFGSANGNRTRISALKGPRANRCTIAPQLRRAESYNYTENPEVCAMR